VKETWGLRPDGGLKLEIFGCEDRAMALEKFHDAVGTMKQTRTIVVCWTGATFEPWKQGRDMLQSTNGDRSIWDSTKAMLIAMLPLQKSPKTTAFIFVLCESNVDFEYSSFLSLEQRTISIRYFEFPKRSDADEFVRHNGLAGLSSVIGAVLDLGSPEPIQVFGNRVMIDDLTLASSARMVREFDSTKWSKPLLSIAARTNWEPLLRCPSTQYEEKTQEIKQVIDLALSKKYSVILGRYNR